MAWYSTLGGSLQRKRPEQRTETLTATQLIAERRRGRIYAGVPVNETAALQLSAVWRCVDLLAEIVSTLPIDEYRNVNGVRIEQPLPPLLIDPAGDGTGLEVWLRQMMVSGLLRGNLYGWIEALGTDGWPTQIASVHPDEITPRRKLRSGPVEWYRDNKPVERWPAGPLWHVPFHVVPGSPVGLSPLEFAAQTIGIGIVAQKYGAEWFNQGKIPPSTLVSDQIIDGTLAAALKGRITDSLNEGGPLVLGAGLKFTPISVSPEEAQFLETIEANEDDIAAFFFRRPPGEGGSITYANVEARSLDLLTYALTGWLVRFERAISRLRPGGRYDKFNVDAFLRTDAMTRAKVLDTQIRNGTRSRDEARALDDMKPIPDGTGSQFLWPPGATSVDATKEGGMSDGPSESPASST
jgi:HK97 family phage portal protein